MAVAPGVDASFVVVVYDFCNGGVLSRTGTAAPHLMARVAVAYTAVAARAAGATALRLSSLSARGRSGYSGAPHPPSAGGK